MAKKNPISLEGAVKTEAGLSYKGVIMEPAIEKCIGCDRITSVDETSYCSTYAQPEIKWARGACNFATHVRVEVDKAGKVKVNPLKASKRAARGR